MESSKKHNNDELKIMRIVKAAKCFFDRYEKIEEGLIKWAPWETLEELLPDNCKERGFLRDECRELQDSLEAARLSLLRSNLGMNASVIIHNIRNLAREITYEETLAAFENNLFSSKDIPEELEPYDSRHLFRLRRMENAAILDAHIKDLINGSEILKEPLSSHVQNKEPAEIEPGPKSKKQQGKGEMDQKGVMKIDGGISDLANARAEERKDYVEHVCGISITWEADEMKDGLECPKEICDFNKRHSDRLAGILEKMQEQKGAAEALTSESAQKIVGILERLADYDASQVSYSLDERGDEEEGTARMGLVVQGPVETYIEKNIDILTELYEWIPQDEWIPVLKSGYWSSFRQSMTGGIERRGQNKRRTLELLLRQFEDGAGRYPRLAHGVLTWPFLSKMPRPPRDLLDHCSDKQYEFMERRMNANHYLHLSTPIGGRTLLAKPGTLATHWLIYPKNETWNEDSGRKRFEALAQEASKAAGEYWLKVLHKKRQTYERNDGWDGLFDDDYELDERGYRNCLYSWRMIEDVFLDSALVCNMLIEEMEQKPPEKLRGLVGYVDEEEAKGKEREDTAKELVSYLGKEAVKAKIEEVRTIYKVIILLVQWAYGQMPENYTEYLPAWTNLHARINDRMDRIIEWLKWKKPEVAGDVEEEHNKLMEWGWGDKWKDGDRDDFDTGISMVRGCALSLYEKLQHLAELAEQEELEKSGARKQYQSKAAKEKIPLSDFQLFIDSLIEDFWNVRGLQPDISPDFIKILDYKVEHITQQVNSKDMEQILSALYGQFKSSVEHYNELAQEGFQQIERIELLANANKMISFAIGPVVKHLETIIFVLSKTVDHAESQKLENIGIDEEGLQVLYNGEAYRITERQVRFLKFLIEKRGAWIPGSQLKEHQNERIDKIKGALPKPILDLIESHTRDGYRLNI